MARDVLETCPTEKRAGLAKMAARVADPDTKSGRPSKPAAIRLKCLECCAWQANEVRNCQIFNCALWGLGGQKVDDDGDVGCISGNGG
jgi:hypothetical protein